MNSKTIIAGALGGLALFITGGLVYELLLGDFFASPVNKAEPIFAFILLGEVIGGFLLAWVLNRFGTSSVADGAKDGAIFGFVLGLGLGLTFYGAYNMADLSTHLVDSLVTAFRYGVAGAVIGWWLGRGTSTSAA